MQNTVRELGVPVRGATPTGPFVGRDGSGEACLYVVMGQESGRGLFVLQIDPMSGVCKRFDAPDNFSGARPSFWSIRWNCVFMGASGDEATGSGTGHLLCFDPRTAQVRDLGLICPGRPLFPVAVTEAPDGSLYIGSYRECRLTRYLPASGEFQQLGCMDPVDQFLYPQCGDDGTVACLVKMAHPHVVLVDPASGAHRTVGPVADTQAQKGFVNLLKGSDGLLYIESHEGVLQLHAGQAVPVPTKPPSPPPATLPDGSTFRWLDRSPYRIFHKTMEVKNPDGERRVLNLDYEAGGCGIYLVRPGPDQKLYGSSALPLHFFSHDPATGQTIDFGGSSVAGGQTYSMECLDGKLYACVYTHGILSVYDPAKPYTFGEARNVPVPLHPLPRQQDPARWLGWSLELGNPEYSNPCILGRMDAVAFRPRDMVAGPAGKVWVVSVPDYGMWGGTLSWYDPRTDSFGGAHRDVIKDCSLIALTYLPETQRLIVGSCIYGGSGTVPRVSRAGLAVWDPEQDCAVSSTDLGLHIIGVMDLEAAGEGLAYAIIHVAPETVLHAELVLFDPQTGRIVAQTNLSEAADWPLEVTFQQDATYVYGATRTSIYRVKRGTVNIEVLWADPQFGPTAGGALIGNRYYFATHSQLRVIDV